MREIDPALRAHLNTGATTLARVWKITRKDGVVLGFTDHDQDLQFEGDLCAADTALQAKAIQSTLGLSTDNSEVMGALNALAISEADLDAGLFDDALIRQWIVNWADVTQSLLKFTGQIGEVRRLDGAFEAEIRGASEPLNNPVGRSYTRRCQHVLGDGRCSINLGASTWRAEATVTEIVGRGQIVVSLPSSFETGWFEGGSAEWISGAAAGSTSVIAQHHAELGLHRLIFWENLGAAPIIGDTLTLTAGCNKSAKTCKAKFGNLINFGGFPYIPGEDFSAAYPKSGGDFDGGSLYGGLPDE